MKWSSVLQYPNYQFKSAKQSFILKVHPSSKEPVVALFKHLCHSVVYGPVGPLPRTTLVPRQLEQSGVRQEHAVTVWSQTVTVWSQTVTVWSQTVTVWC